MLDDVDACEQHIRSVSTEDRIIFLVNGQLAREIIPRIHSLRQVVAIYIYSMEKNKQNDEWVKPFQKVNKFVIFILETVLFQIYLTTLF